MPAKKVIIDFGYVLKKNSQMFYIFEVKINFFCCEIPIEKNAIVKK